jgi:hypothetical protein
MPDLAGVFEGEVMTLSELDGFLRENLGNMYAWDGCYNIRSH